jgi:hypothetical protein
MRSPFSAMLSPSDPTSKKGELWIGPFSHNWINMPSIASPPLPHLWTKNYWNRYVPIVKSPFLQFESTSSRDGTAAAVNQTAATAHPTAPAAFDWHRAAGNTKETEKM